MEDGKFNQNKYIQRYVKENYSRISIVCRPEVKEELKKKATAAGLTLSQYLIKKGLEEKMEEYMRDILKHLTTKQAVYHGKCDGSGCTTCMYRRDEVDYSEKLVGTGLPAICRRWERP